MGRSVRLVLWLGVLLLEPGAGAGAPPPLPGIDDRSFVDECVREHNRARSGVSPPASDMLYMTWDAGLAVTARAWARRCTFEHNIYRKQAHRMHPSFPSVGENLWTGSPPSSFDATRAIRGWVDEKVSYSYGPNTCNGVCGHYTQVVWASSYKVGCAVQLCPDGVRGFTKAEGAIFVCNYATAGNINGLRPYQSNGAPCSGCEGNCVENLCRSKDRDTEQSYNWTPDWDSAPASASAPAPAPASETSSAGSSGYVSVLVVRPCALILTFVAAYVVHYFYPDIFCYE